MKSLSLLIGFIIAINVSGQIKISDVYLSSGYLYSNPDGLNASLNSYHQYFRLPFQDNLYLYHSDIEFKQINGFTNFGIGTIVSFTKLHRLYFDFSFGFLYCPDQFRNATTYKTFDGIDSNDEVINGNMLYTGDSATYSYGYRMNTLTFNIIPTYKLVNLKWFSIDLGAGLVYYHTFIQQDGIEFYLTYSLWSTSDTSMKSNNGALSWQSHINFCFEVSKHIFIDTQIRYRFGKVKNLTNFQNDFFNHTDDILLLYPISNTDIDYSGLDFSLRCRYRF